MHSDGQTDQRNSRRRVRGREPRSDNDAWASYQRQQNFGRVSSVQATPVAIVLTGWSVGNRSSRGTFSSLNDTPPRPQNPSNGIGDQLERMMELMSSMDRRLTAMERSGLNGPSQGSQLQQTFGIQYRGGGAEPSFYRIGSPIRERRPEDESRTNSRRDGSRERDVFSKSEKWLPHPPEPKVEKWLNREAEIEGFFSYVQALRAWSQLASDKMAEEIQQAIKWPSEIVTSTLTQGQQARSARLFALLKVAFASHVRIDSLIRAYEAGCAIHNSPTKPFGSCGYELLRILALEFSLRTRTEAICLRSELLKRDVKVDSKSVHAMSDLIRGIQVAVNRYDRLVETLPPDISRADLLVTPSDMSLMFIRNMPHDAKQYCLLHSENESWEALQLSALKYERQQRLYVELGAMSKKFINETREVADLGFVETDYVDDGQVSVLKQGCGRCGKKTHETKDCDTNLANTKCFKCGKTGHIGRNCRMGKLLMVTRVEMLKGKRRVNPKEKPRPPPNLRVREGVRVRCLKLGKKKHGKKLRGVMKNHLGVVMHLRVDCKWLCLAFTPKIPKVRLSFLVPGLALIAEMMRVALVHIHM